MLVPREKGEFMSYNTETNHKCSHPECKVCNPRPTRPPFDGEAWVAGVLRSIWAYQGEDILQCAGIDYNSGKSIPRSQVIECVLDAGNPRTFGEREARKDPEKLFALNAFLKLSYEQKIKFCKSRVFPCKRYGW